MGHEIWFTVLLNKLLAGILTRGLTVVGAAPADPAHPIPNYIAMEVMVFGIIVVGAFLLRGQLSVETPGKFQQLMEVAVEFVQNMASEIIGHIPRERPDRFYGWGREGASEA